MITNFPSLFIGLRYLKPSKKNTMVSIISLFSFLGIVLGVGTLIIVMSIMNGFKIELLDKIIGINGHLNIHFHNKDFNQDQLSNFLDSNGKVKSFTKIIDGQGLLSVEKNSTIKAWTGPFIMAMANTRVVRRGAALLEELGEGYGKDFVYKEHAYYSSAKTAYITTGLLALVGLVIATPLNRLVRPFLKKPGQGPNQKAMDSGFFKCTFVVKGKNGEEKIYGLRGSGDPGYKVTSKLVCESAISLLVDGSLLPGGPSWGGILTPSSGLGNVLVGRLKKAGIIFEEIL